MLVKMKKMIASGATARITGDKKNKTAMSRHFDLLRCAVVFKRANSA